MNLSIPDAILQSADIALAADLPPLFTRPLYGCRVPAGFPSPADDYIEKELDTN